VDGPSGEEVGLALSLALHAMPTYHGIIRTVLRPIRHGLPGDAPEFQFPFQDEGRAIAPAGYKRAGSPDGDSRPVACREGARPVLAQAGEITVADRSPAQSLSLAPALIPFIEHDDPDSARRGACAMLAALPLARPKAPLVGTGLEAEVAVGCGAFAAAESAGTVTGVDAGRITVLDFPLNDGTRERIYRNGGYRDRTPGAWPNRRALVGGGDHMEKGQPLADGPAVDLGELALGRDVNVAFMPWAGFNEGESFVASERLVSEDVFTSWSFRTYRVAAREPRLGPERITRAVPGGWNPV
jgi:DNA-directed RNA polymerase subunit beta